MEMKVSSKPFKARQHGTCAVCRKAITKRAMIVRLEKPVAWIENKKLIPHGGGRFFVDQRSSQYAHAGCMEGKDD